MEMELMKQSMSILQYSTPETERYLETMQRKKFLLDKSKFQLVRSTLSQR